MICWCCYDFDGWHCVWGGRTLVTMPKCVLQYVPGPRGALGGTWGHLGSTWEGGHKGTRGGKRRLPTALEALHPLDVQNPAGQWTTQSSDDFDKLYILWMYWILRPPPMDPIAPSVPKRTMKFKNV